MNDLGHDIGKAKMEGDDDDLDQIRQREREQKIERLDRYRPAVIAYMRRHGFSSDDADDLTQRVFLRVCQNVDAYRGDAALAYLTKVAKSVVANWLRDLHAQKRDAVEESLDKATGLADQHVVGADERLYQKERAERLRQAVTQLDPGQRACVVLYLQGHSHDEMEKMLHLSVSALKSRLHAARQRLRELMGVDLPGRGGES